MQTTKEIEQELSKLTKSQRKTLRTRWPLNGELTSLKVRLRGGWTCVSWSRGKFPRRFTMLSKRGKIAPGYG